MKKLILLFSLCMMVISCKEEKMGGNSAVSLLVKNYVILYLDPTELYSKADTWDANMIRAGAKITQEIDTYNSPELWQAMYPEREPHDQKFTEIAERNKDTGYDKERWWLLIGFGPRTKPNAFADNFSSIEVVCTNAAWDDAHPAGTPLNDLITFGFISYADFVQGGYKDEGLCDFREKPLTELSPTDLHMLSPNFTLKFDLLAASGSYDILITMTTVDGVKKTTTCPMVIK